MLKWRACMQRQLPSVVSTAGSRSEANEWNGKLMQGSFSLPAVRAS